MLEQIRQFAQIKIVRWIFVAFLVGIFGLFGIETYLQRPAGGDVIASVGSARIGQVEFDGAMRDQAEQYRRQFRGAFDASIMDNPEIRRGVLDRLISEKLLAVGSERAGLRIPDKALAERIANEPGFQVDGKFSRERYDVIAKSNNMTPVALDERLRKDYQQTDFRNAVTETAFVPKTTLDTFIRLSEQTREVSVVNLALDAYLPKVKVTPEQVKSYYDGHAAEFTIPESAKIEYVEFSLDQLAAKAQVPAEEVKRAYEAGMQTNRWGQAEERKASHILITSAEGDDAAKKKAAEEKARAIYEQLKKNPKSFAEVAKKESQDPGSAVQGGDLGFFNRTAMVKPFGDAVWGARKGDLLPPVKSEFGWHVILVTDIKPANVKSLADATPEIEAGIKKDLAARAFAEQASEFSRVAYEESGSLKPAADLAKVPVQPAQWVVKGQSPNALLNNSKLQAEIFSDDSIKGKRNTSAIEVAPNVLIVARVLEHKPAAAKPLDTVKGDIERRLQREEAMKLAKADGEAKLKALQEGKDAGVKFPAPLAVNRQKPGGLNPAVIDKAFRADTKKLPSYVGAETSGGYALVQVSKVIELQQVQDAQRQALGEQLRQVVSFAQLESTLGAVRDKVGVSVRADAVQPKKAAN